MTKPCPECGKQVWTEARICPHCKKRLGAARLIAEIMPHDASDDGQLLAWRRVSEDGAGRLNEKTEKEFQPMTVHWTNVFTRILCR